MIDDDWLCDLQADVLPPMAIDTRVSILDGALAGRAGRVVECDGMTTTVEVRDVRPDNPDAAQSGGGQGGRGGRHAAQRRPALSIAAAIK